MFLILGSRGMLGRAWVRELQATSTPHEVLGRPQLDLMRPASLAEVPWGRYEAVVNCAAWTDVDGAETSEAEATAVNGAAVTQLARYCAEARTRLVHYSTDYVFAGNATVPYPVDGPLHPINAYGRSKAAGEEGVRAASDNHLLIRTSWVYAPWGKNFVRTIAKLCGERDTLQVVDDQRGRPTSATHLASVSAALVREHGSGTYHVTDGGECTWFDLASAVAARIAPTCRVEPCGSDVYPRPAKRPGYSVLDLHRTEKLVGPMTPWQDGVAAVLSELAESPATA